MSVDLFPLISIIIPVFNVEKYLKNCLESVLNQSYKNLEIILIDDGSTDSSGMICDEYKSKNPNITVIHKENGGLSDARNRGLSVCNGVYVEFVDSDDVIEKDLTLKLYLLIKKSNSDISICDYIDCYDNKTKPKFSKSDKTFLLSNIDCLSLLFYQKCSFSAWAKLYKKELFKTHTFKKGLLFEDVDLIPKLVLASKSIVYNKSKLYGYLHRKNSITTKKFTKNECVILEIAKNYYKEFDSLPSIVRKATASYLITVAFRVYLNTMNSNELLFYTNQSENLIKRQAKFVLFDKRARVKNKIAILLFYFMKKLLFVVYNRLIKLSK